MCQNKILEKLLAIILIFTLTFVNFAFTAKSVAFSLAETLFGSASVSTGHKNVSFEAFFGDDEEKYTEKVLDVNSDEAIINLNVNVAEAGYLKNAKIIISPKDQDGDLNFKISESQEESELIEQIEENEITLKQIDCDSSLKYNLQIEYENNEFFKEEMLSKDAVISFTGIYVDENGKETSLSKDIELNISWKDDREFSLSSEVSKFFDYGSGKILQICTEVDTSTSQNTLPVKSTKLTFEIPELNGVYPSDFNISMYANLDAKSEKTAVGKNITDYVYDENNQTLSFQINNEPEMVNINEEDEDFLKEENGEIEVIKNLVGKSEYFVTYTYPNVSVSEDKITSDVSVDLITYSGDKNAQNINVNSKNILAEYEISSEVGNLLSIKTENETDNISKAYMYYNLKNQNQYDIELNSNTIVNIAYCNFVNEIVIEDNTSRYIISEDNYVENTDLIYKKIEIEKDNFTEILGDDGKIQLLDINGNIIVELSLEGLESDKITYNFENNYSKIIIKTTAPVKEGNLLINKTRYIKEISFSKKQIEKFSKIEIEEILKSNILNSSELEEICKTKIITNLQNTTTYSNFELSKNTFSTSEENKNIELKIKLNNNTKLSDIYGKSTFKIEMPSYTEKIDITNYQLAYAEGLEISKININGKIIEIELIGCQEKINSGALTNGTNIILNLNITLNKFTPPKKDYIKLTYENSEATNYVNSDGYYEEEITYSSATGVVSASMLSGYNEDNSLISIKQGTQTDTIKINSEALNVRNDLIVMNNQDYSISNVYILGRIPFNGVTNVYNSEDLGTTVNVELLNSIKAKLSKDYSYTIYYSSNEDATKELSDESNGWNANPESLSDVKSYLIVIDNEILPYEMLDFYYEYEIPENLSYNSNIYGSFITYYTLNEDEFTSVPDIVGLTTGNGPELEATVSLNKSSLREYDYFEATIVVKNKSERAEGIVVKVPTPEYASFESLVSKSKEIEFNSEASGVIVNCASLDKEEELKFVLKYSVNSLPLITISDEQGNEDSSTEEYKVCVEARVTSNEITNEIIAKSEEVLIGSSDLRVTQVGYNNALVDYPMPVDTVIEFRINVYNKTENTKRNIVVTQKLPEGVDFVNSYVIHNFSLTQEEGGSFDENTRTITWKVDTFEGNEQIAFGYNIKLMKVNTNEKVITYENAANVTVNGEEEYSSNGVKYYYANTDVSIVQTSNSEGEKVKCGDKISYTFEITNNSAHVIRELKFEDVLPTGLNVFEVKYNSNGSDCTFTTTDRSKINYSMQINADSKIIITFDALVASVSGDKEIQISNYANLYCSETDTITSNSINHIIIPSDKKVEGNKQIINNDVDNEEIAKTYSISGTAWLDENNDGIKSTNEGVLPGVSAMLVESQTGIIESYATTDVNGKYTFSNIENGTYIVVFDYNLEKYTTTIYRKSGVQSDINSDVFNTKIEQNGVERTSAITDIITVSGTNIYNIDIGLVDANKFDLELTKAISKITIQTSKGTSAINYDNVSLGKAEIASKYLSGASVYIEYTFTIKNAGNVTGYAKKIVDYIPEGMEFNSSLNKNWYTGTDGNIYTNYTENNELLPGESTSFKLILIKNMTSNNTGLIHNTAEIAEDYNILGYKDCNSTVLNNVQSENDIGSADAVILVKTGERVIYISIWISSILLVVVIGLFIFSMAETKRKKERSFK